MEASVSFQFPPRFFLIREELVLLTLDVNSEEEDPDEYPFPLTLKTKTSAPGTPLQTLTLNGN